VAQASLPFTLLLGVLVALTALGMDMFLPAVPVIARALAGDSGPGVAQVTVTTYLAGLALGQLAWGPVSDRFGRKPVLLCGLGLALCAALWGALASSIGELAVVRMAQGIGMSSGPVIARSIVRDLYAREQAAHLLARMMAVFGIVPVAAPLLGAQAIGLGGWTTVFYVFTAILVLLLAAVGFGLRETAPSARLPISPRTILASYRTLFGNTQFRAALATMVCAQMGIIAFVSSSSIAMVDSMSLSPAQFGGLFALVMLGQISGGIAASRFVARLGIGLMVRTGARIALFSGLVLAALSLAGSLHWSAVVLPMLLYIFGCAFLIPSGIATALSPFPQMAGAASSLLGALPFALGAVVSAALAAAYDGSTRPMALAIGLFGALAFLAERLYFRKLAHG
jgi:MFS transporter, DHA1 family, multidrug resistance protein